LPFQLRLYQGLTALFAYAVPTLLRQRAAAGKEDAARLDERLGLAPIERPMVQDGGALVWIHGASVGESMVALSVADRLRQARPDLTFIFTSGTKTSADLIAARLSPPDLHRYVPVDTPHATQAFVAGWKPDLAIFVEGEVWPNLIVATQNAGTKMALINARMSAKSLNKWARRPASARRLFGCFDVVLPADSRTRDALAYFRGEEIGEAGNLKLAAPAPNVDAPALKALRTKLGKRPVWLAASTHPSEEKALILAHSALMTAAPDALLILAPRHPERGNDVEVDCRIAGFVPARRSKAQVPTGKDAIWLWDTLGELGLAMSLAPVTFMGGSLAQGIGGHNPVEPALIGSAIVTGARVHNFEGLYQELEEAKGARVLDAPTSDMIAMTVAGLLGDKSQLDLEISQARAVIARGKGAMEATVAALLSLLS
jgi:3-deoxy-D-manno-octulosonic-acid transferase